MPARFFVDWNSKLKAIAEETQRIREQGRPVLIGTRTIAKSLDVVEALKKCGMDPVLLNGMQDREEAEIIAEAGRPGAVTVATNMAGRGTDIRLQASARDAGGLHVIVTEPHDSNRVDQQLIGRAARQGDPGSARIFISGEDNLFQDNNCHWIERAVNKTVNSGEIHLDLLPRILSLQHQNEKKNQLIREKMAHHERWLDSVKSDCESFS